MKLEYQQEQIDADFTQNYFSLIFPYFLFPFFNFIFLFFYIIHKPQIRGISQCALVTIMQFELFSRLNVWSGRIVQIVCFLIFIQKDFPNCHHFCFFYFYFKLPDNVFTACSYIILNVVIHDTFSNTKSELLLLLKFKLIDDTLSSTEKI